MSIKLLQGDCLKRMKEIPDGSVDMILTDLPYGTTDCEWDNAIPFVPLWEEYLRIAKHNAAIVLFSAQPFTTDLINSNRKLFRYDIIWEKTMPVGFLNAKRMPLRAHEIICVFYRKLPTYNPQKNIKESASRGRKIRGGTKTTIYGGRKGQHIYYDTGKREPVSVVRFSNRNGIIFGKHKGGAKHPTAKPVELLEYLINTYTNAGETVLDSCMGSGSTGVACVNTARNFIGIELEPDFYSIAEQRISEAARNHNNEPNGKPSGNQEKQLTIDDLCNQ